MVVFDGSIIKNLRYSRVSIGKVKNPHHCSVVGIGFIGQGPYKPSTKYISLKSYSTWVSMLQRCYSNITLERQPTYKGCVVVEEWHNFQNFAKWFEEKYNPEIMKD